MKKTLIALAVGSAFAAPAAYADVTLSGSINMGPAYIHAGDGSNGVSNGIVGAIPPGLNTVTNGVPVTTTTGTKSSTVMGIATNYSNITIGSLEDLGGGLKLDFAFQMDVGGIAQGGSTVKNRNSHIGLVGDSWGGVWYGSNEMLYESYFYTVDPLDGAAGLGGNLSVMGTPGFGNVFDNPGANASACTNANGGTGCAGFYRRDSNAIWYNSPNFNGFSGGAYMTLPDSTASQAVGNVSGINPWLWGLGVKWVGPSMPLQAWAAYEHHHDMFGTAAINPVFGTPGSTGGVTASSHDYGAQVGVGYTFGDIFAYVNFEQLKYETDLNPGIGAGNTGGTVEYKRNAWSIGAKWNVSTGYVGGQFMNMLNGSCTLPNTGCSADHTSGWMVGLGYYHTLSKQTQAFIMGQYISNGDLQSISNGGGVGAPFNLGSTSYGLEVGLKHSF